MIRMIVSRLASSSLSIVILVTLVFFMAHLTPGGPAYSILGMKATASSVAQLNARLGLNAPLWQQYAHLVVAFAAWPAWLFLSAQPPGRAVALALRAEHAGLLHVSIVISTALSIGLGLLQGVYFGRWPAKLIGALQLGFYALPPFFVAAMLVLWFSVQVRLFPASGISDLRAAHPSIGHHTRIWCCRLPPSHCSPSPRCRAISARRCARSWAGIMCARRWRKV